jgi:hypothetical protein
VSWRDVLGADHSEANLNPQNPHNPHNPQNSSRTDNSADIAGIAHKKLERAPEGVEPVTGWREALGADHSNLYTHTPHNAQHIIDADHFADCAHSAHQSSEDVESHLLEQLANVCSSLPISPSKVMATMAAEDVEDWRTGVIDVECLAAFAAALVELQEIDSGKQPTHFTEQATCKHCGPIWHWDKGQVLSCPWCRNRISNKPIPRPGSIRCGDCLHFNRTDYHPNLGHCAKGQPEAVVGLCDGDQRYCDWYLPTSLVAGET